MHTRMVCRSVWFFPSTLPLGTKCHHRKSADWTRFNTSVSSRHRTDESLRTGNKSFIVLKNPNHNNRQIRQKMIFWRIFCRPIVYARVCIVILLSLLTLNQPVDTLSRWRWGENRARRKRIKEKGRKRERRGSTHQPQSYSLSATSLSASSFSTL